MESGARQMGSRPSSATLELGASGSSLNLHLLKPTPPSVTELCWLYLLNISYPCQLVSASEAFVQTSNRSH